MTLADDKYYILRKKIEDRINQLQKDNDEWNESRKSGDNDCGTFDYASDCNELMISYLKELLKE